MVMDVWSRRILGIEMHKRECSQLASKFFDRICRDEGIIQASATILHSDNGAPMRSFTLAAKLVELGVASSLVFSMRRRISGRADSKCCYGLGSGWHRAIASNAVMSCNTACIPSRIESNPVRRSRFIAAVSRAANTPLPR